MTISYPLTLPSSIRFTSSNWVSVDVTSEMTSPFTGDSNVIVWDAQWWECTLTSIPLLPEDAQTITAFLRKLRGKSGTFYMGDPLRTVPYGSAASAPGTPLVNGANQSGDTLVIDGAPASATNYLKAGDLISLGTGSAMRAYEVLDNASSDGSGNVTLTIWPNLRASPANNEAVTVTAVKSVFSRKSDVIESPYSNRFITISFDVKEALRQ